MRVRLQPADSGGCGNYRLRWPGAALQAMGADVVIAERHLEGERMRSVLGDRLVRIPDPDCDVVVFQRPMDPGLVEALPVLRRQGVATVVEIDDDFHALPKGHPARRHTAAMLNPDMNRVWLRRLCEAADLVTCTTPALAERYAPHGRAAIIPNYVPAWYLNIDPGGHDGPPIVGWTGSTVTHVGDLDVTGGAVARAMDATGARLHIVGTGHGVREGLDLGDRPYTASGWLPADRYPTEYAGLDVAIVPLDLNRFNESKSYLKGLEAAALGVPFVASPTGPYRTLVAGGEQMERLVAERPDLVSYGHAPGLLADTPDDWERHLTALLSDPEYRRGVAASGAAFAARNTIEGNCWRWLEAWEQAVTNMRNRKAKVPA